MANMNINITGLDTIAQAINNLAQALGKGGVTASFSESTPAGIQCQTVDKLPAICETVRSISRINI